MAFGEDGNVCDVAIWEACLEQMQLFKFCGCVLNEREEDDTDIKSKIRKVIKCS